MCKVYIQAGINDKNRELSLNLIKEMTKIMSKEIGHDDGVGYAATDKGGELFAERWLYNSEAFNTRESLSELDKKIVNSSFGQLNKTDKYNSSGKVKLDDITAITLHIRKSTSNKGFANTHPFIEDDTSVIHNGMINNHDDIKIFRKGNTTCDSEVILTKYNDVKLYKDIKNVEKLTNNLRGYYTCGIFSLDNDGNRILDILKSKTGSLICGYIKELDSLVYTSVLPHLIDACKVLNLTLESWYQVNELTMTRLDALSGEFLGGKDFQEQGTSKYGIGRDMNYTYNREYHD